VAVIENEGCGIKLSGPDRGTCKIAENDGVGGMYCDHGDIKVVVLAYQGEVVGLRGLRGHVSPGRRLRRQFELPASGQ
jgi:hypothetical protein